jgi:hypothetical protein
MSTTTYHANEGVSVQAELYKVKTPQVPGTVIAGRNHYLVRKGGARVVIQIGDYIIRGENGEVDAMPPALFNQLFTIDADEVQTKVAAAKESAAAAEAQAEADAQDEADAQAEADAEAAADAADAATEQVIDEPIAGDEVNIFDPTDDVPAAPEAPADPPPKKAKKKSRRKKKT